MTTADATESLPRLLLSGDVVIASERSVLQPGYVLTGTDGRVVSVSGERPATGSYDEESRAAVVCPGFVDMHNHGLGGSGSVMSYWMTPEYTTSRLPRHGTTGVVATVVWAESDLATSDCSATSGGPRCSNSNASCLN